MATAVTNDGAEKLSASDTLLNKKDVRTSDGNDTLVNE